jgi:hypothetical protein
MREASSGRHPKRWFDGRSPQEHIRDGLQLLVRVVLLTVSAVCL